VAIEIRDFEPGDHDWARRLIGHHQGGDHRVARLGQLLDPLEQEGIVERTVVPETPVRVEYSLTKKGRALATAMDAIAEWAEKWIDARGPVAEPAPVRTRRRG